MNLSLFCGCSARRVLPVLFISASLLQPLAAADAELIGRIMEARSGEPVAARLYVETPGGEFLHVQPADAKGTAIPYSVRRGQSVEVHTSLSAHPFRLQAPAGRYRLTVERGKEYLPVETFVDLVDGEPIETVLEIDRWSNLAARGWYSGETHVHRPVEELPTLLLAEDLNVAFPLTAWVTDSQAAPAGSGEAPRAELQVVDETHVFWPVNTEYELFSVNGRQHTLGAVFVLNHRQPLTLTAPPLTPIADEARRQGAFLDLDKHNWPWSIAAARLMQVDLYELTNNHLWRTDFHFGDWYPEYAPEYMQLDMPGGEFTESSWIEFGLQTYYALLNCGLNLRPTAGTASGVHPVPLGFGRVYVNTGGEFSYDRWVEGLLAGRSFVTTGPLLLVEQSYDEPSHRVFLVGEFSALAPPSRIEVVVNGDVRPLAELISARGDDGAYHLTFRTSVDLTGESWVAVRAFVEPAPGRVAFAHTAPRRYAAPGPALRPTAKQKQYVVDRVAGEIERSAELLSPAARAEYDAALAYYQSLETSQESTEE